MKTKRRRNEQLALSLVIGQWPEDGSARWFCRPYHQYTADWTETTYETYSADHGKFIVTDYVQIFPSTIPGLLDYDDGGLNNYAQLLTLLAP